MADETEDRPERAPDRRRRFRKLRSLFAHQACEPSAVTEDHVLSILAYRRAREVAFGRELFTDPGWDILLELLAAHLGGRRMTLCDLAQSIDIPASTAKRWAAALAEHGLIVSSSDLTDTDSASIDLSAHGLAGMRRLMNYWGSAFRSI